MLWVIVDYPFSLLYNVILCEYTMIYLPVWLLISIWVVSSFELLWIEPLWTLLCMSFGDNMCAFLSFFFWPGIFSFFKKIHYKYFFIYQCWSKNPQILSLLHFSGIIHFQSRPPFHIFFLKKHLFARLYGVSAVAHRTFHCCAQALCVVLGLQDMWALELWLAGLVVMRHVGS